MEREGEDAMGGMGGAGSLTLLNYITSDISIMSIDRKTIIENERKTIFAKPIVTANPAFDVAQIEDFFNLFNLYADVRRQADVREIVTTAHTLGYDKTHEFIYKGLANIALTLDGQWVGF